MPGGYIQHSDASRAILYVSIYVDPLVLVITSPTLLHESHSLTYPDLWMKSSRSHDDQEKLSASSHLHRKWLSSFHVFCL